MIAVFDIGKTNKKFVVFDEQFRKVHESYAQLSETTDEDGFPCDDLPALLLWMETQLAEAVAQFPLRALNFSTYGASFVHLDAAGQPVAPLYNYLKPFPEALHQRFFAAYGPVADWCRETASPDLGMLNSGLQLYWLKQQHPQLHQRIRYSLHFPQFLSHYFTGKPISDYTSLGCHTGLWRPATGDYHPWVAAEGLRPRLAPPVSGDWLQAAEWQGHPLLVGPGIHDSSAALLPYLYSDSEPFLLLSTGTWSIALNPFSQEPLSEADLQADCLSFLRTDGKPVKAARLFLGHEFKEQVSSLHEHFGLPFGQHRALPLEAEVFSAVKGLPPCFRFEAFPQPDGPAETDYTPFSTFSQAYHRLCWELIQIQGQQIHRAIGRTPISKLYLDGGFVNNDVFTRMLASALRDLPLVISRAPLGSALGAALQVGKSLGLSIPSQLEKRPLFPEP